MVLNFAPKPAIAKAVEGQCGAFGDLHGISAVGQDLLETLQLLSQGQRQRDRLPAEIDQHNGRQFADMAHGK
ncbi:hypothetical protein [Pseudomonas syringae]|uniref:hypothetical protein n=1 Tax=Pseudomonas syringae TaxID=317 RepID=UPI000EFE4E68|nr:hypothetical protein [Pseudomonas azotoformans]